MATKKTLLAASILTLTALAAVPPAAADAGDTVHQLCYVMERDPCGPVVSMLRCQEAFGDRPGVVGQTLYFVAREYVVACEWSQDQNVIVSFVVLAGCTATVDYLADGHCDGPMPGPYEPGPVTCKGPGPAGPGIVGATTHYVLVMEYITCLAASMEAGSTVDAVMASCTATSEYLFGTPCRAA